MLLWTAVVRMHGVVTTDCRNGRWLMQHRRLQHHKPLRFAWWGAAAGGVTVVDTKAALF